MNRLVPPKNDSAVPRRVELSIAVASALLFLMMFADREQLAFHNDIIAQADIGSYVYAAKAFSLSAHYGDHFAPLRCLDVVAQEHKIKHVLFFILSAPLVELAQLAGFSTFAALKLFNAVVGGVGVLLSCRLFRVAGVAPALIAPLGALVTVTPGYLLYASVPESWPLSGALGVGLLLLGLRDRPPLPLLAVLTAVAMLNNPVLGAAMVVPVVMTLIGPRTDRVQAALKACLAGVAAAMIWLAMLTLLSVWEEGFRPDRYLAFLRWFSGLYPPPTLSDLATLRRVLQRVLLVPFAAGTTAVDFSIFDVGDSWESGRLARAAIVSSLVLWGSAFLGVLIRIARPCSCGADVRIPVAIAAFLLLLLVTYQIGSPLSLLLYSSTLIPAMVALIGRGLTELKRPRSAWALVCAGVLVIGIASVRVTLKWHTESVPRMSGDQSC